MKQRYKPVYMTITFLNIKTPSHYQRYKSEGVFANKSDKELVKSIVVSSMSPIFTAFFIFLWSHNESSLFQFL